MTVSIHSAEYKRVLAKLIEIRRAAGMTQRDLAKILDRENSFVWRIETGKRRLDVVEFYWVCRALRRDAVAVYREIFEEITASPEAVLLNPKRDKTVASRTIPRRKQ
jgi:transcriptional regulator with XRE-family HTH domain